jgi:zinc protease
MVNLSIIISRDFVWSAAGRADTYGSPTADPYQEHESGCVEQSVGFVVNYDNCPNSKNRSSAAHLMNSIKLSFIAASLLLVVTGCKTATEPSALATGSALPEGITLLESVQRTTADELTIPYKKYRLENGLTVILHQDHSDPLVHVDVTYHVGSGREEVGKSGFAHFFEHMMFQGSENVADEQHFKIVAESGGTSNGSTSNDRTNYFETVPANQLEKMLWLEADRMGFLLDAVTQEKFEVQRDTVKNERGQSYDNRPYGLLNERVNEALYPEGHPYSWMPIGYLEDLDRVNVNDLKKFFLRWYGPNNATLTVGGDFDPDQALQWVSKYYGSIPRGPDVERPEKPPVSLDKDRYISMQDRVSLPLLYMSFPTVYLHHADEAPLDVLMFILGQGETSLLYKNMVKNGLAVQASSNHACLELSCTFTIVALPNPALGKSLADLEKITRDSLVEFAERGVNDDDLTRVKMNIVSGMIYRLESVAGKVTQLADYEIFDGNPNYAAEDIARYQNVTKEDVMRVYQQYIAGKPAVIMSIVPYGKLDQVAHTDTWSRHERTLPEYMATSETDLHLRRAKDNFDRSIMPPAGPNPSVILPKIWRAEFDNGLRVLGAVNDETPTTAISLSIDVGQRDEPLDKLGLAALTAAMMNESTNRSTNEELSNRLQKLGSMVRFAAGNNTTTMSVRSLSENLDATLEIAAEKLLQPKFDSDDFARVKAQTLQAIEQSKTQAAVTISGVYQQLLFGRDNPFAYLNIGTVATVSKLSLDDVKQFYVEHYAPGIASVIAVSNFAHPILFDKLQVFAPWQGPRVHRTPLQPFADIGSTKIYLIDKPGAAQSEVRIVKRSLTFDATGEYFRANLMNYPLGGAFNSRINLNLREDKGYTYGAGSRFSGEEDYGAYVASAAVRTDVTTESIVELEKEIRNYAENGITEPELTFTRNAIGQRDARRYETPMQKLVFLSRIVTYKLDDDFVDQQKTILAGISQKEINELARRHLKMDEMIIVVVGDKQAILPGLESLGYEIVELDVNGSELAENDLPEPL